MSTNAPRPVPAVARPVRGAALACALVALLAGCGAPGPLIPEQQPAARRGASPPPAPTVYRVERGDTLYSIAFGYGLDWRRVADWNNIDPPYTIHAGDTIRLRPPPDMRAAIADAGPPRRPGAGDDPVPEQRRPASGGSAGDASGASSGERPAPEPAPSGPPPAPEPEPESRPEPAERPPSQDSGTGSVPDAPSRLVAGVRWRWPTAGRVSRAYDASAARKGIHVAGEAGQDVRAAADGQVVYSGDGLIGYGQLIIIKHSDRMLSAYAHNRERLVGEGDRVRAGQRIATMGRNERDETVLHFEIRRDGKPVDPTDYLPAR
jgi:lipoprotein NlpD